MILLVGHYNETHTARALEIAQCLQRNCALERFERVLVFLEDESTPALEHEALQHEKLQLVPVGHRLKFEELFEYASRELAGQVCVIANNDIYFDETLGELVGFDFEGKLLCLSRWETQEDGTITNGDYPNSQDAWIFRAPLKPFLCDWHLGLLASDTRLAHEARTAGLCVLNPCQSIRAIHVHLTDVHNYDRTDWVLGIQSLVIPQRLEQEPKGVPAAQHPMGFNPSFVLSNKMLPIMTLGRRKQ
jgi:hypothetical protein